MTLPCDFARCTGTGWLICTRCLRNSPPCDGERQVHIAPAIVGGVCENFVDFKPSTSDADWMEVMG